jgi:hypothetical protein
VILSYPLYTVILADVPGHITGYFYYLEFGMTPAGLRT